jgi:hypothetical protein
VLGDAKGRVYTAEDLRRKFTHSLFLRTTNAHGCVTLHHYHFYVEAGLPQQRVLLWLAGDRLRAEYESVVLAEYRCRYDWQERKVTDIREGVLYQTRFTSSQGTLIPLTPQDRWVVYRPKPPRRWVPKGSPVQRDVRQEW